jgi:hypothetical protein
LIVVWQTSLNASADGITGELAIHPILIKHIVLIQVYSGQMNEVGDGASLNQLRYYHTLVSVTQE